jgi:hypothetical protein
LFRASTTATATAKTTTRSLQFAIEELRGLSDSGVFTTLALAGVASAESGRGVFHHNWFFTVDLASPHLRGGAPTSRHEIVVMESLEDSVRSFAIDEFPDMEPDAIETHWQAMVERHKRKREASFARIERQELELDAGAVGIADLDAELARIAGMDGADLERLVEEGERDEEEKAAAGLKEGEEAEGSDYLTAGGLRADLASAELDRRWDMKVGAEQAAFDGHVERTFVVADGVAGGSEL